MKCWVNCGSSTRDLDRKVKVFRWVAFYFSVRSDLKVDSYVELTLIISCFSWGVKLNL